MADDPGFLDGTMVLGAPRLELGVQHRVQLFLRWIPRLEQVVVEVDDVDGVDCSVGVGVRGQQHSSRIGVQVHRLFEELHAVHLRHAIVRQQHGHGLTAQLQFLEGIEGLGPRFGTDDSVVLAVVTAKIAGDGSGYSRAVVDAENDRLQ